MSEKVSPLSDGTQERFNNKMKSEAQIPFQSPALSVQPESKWFQIKKPVAKEKDEFDHLIEAAFMR